MPLLRQVKPSRNGGEDAVCALAATEGATFDPEEFEPREFATLPEANYKSSRVALEREVRDRKGMKRELPKAFGKQDNVEAVVSGCLL